MLNFKISRVLKISVLIIIWASFFLCFKIFFSYPPCEAQDQYTLGGKCLDEVRAKAENGDFWSIVRLSERLGNNIDMAQAQVWLRKVVPSKNAEWRVGLLSTVVDRCGSAPPFFMYSEVENWLQEGVRHHPEWSAEMVRFYMKKTCYPSDDAVLKAARYVAVLPIGERSYTFLPFAERAFNENAPIPPDILRNMVSKLKQISINCEYTKCPKFESQNIQKALFFISQLPKN